MAQFKSPTLPNSLSSLEPSGKGKEPKKLTKESKHQKRKRLEGSLPDGRACKLYENWIPTKTPWTFCSFGGMFPKMGTTWVPF